MLVLRKVLGYTTLGLLLGACLFGAISKFTVNGGLPALFQSLRDVQSILSFLSSWVFELVFFVIIGIMSIVALATFHKKDDVAQEGKLQNLLLLYAICELAAAITMIAAYVAVYKDMSHVSAKMWMWAIFPVILIIATIVRKAAFVGKNTMAARIMGACTFLLMAILVIILGFSNPLFNLYPLTQVLFLITFFCGCGFNVVSIFKK